jgi:polar amino acid transport system substrate-binding protein
LFTLLVLASLALTACGGGAAATAEEPAAEEPMAEEPMDDAGAAEEPMEEAPADQAMDDEGMTEPAVDQTVVCGAEAGGFADLGGQEIVFAVENAYPPFNNLDDNGVGVGWDYDMGRALCDALNCVPVFTEAAWDGIFPAMAAGEYDVLFDGVTYTTERDLTVDYFCAYVVLGQVLLVKADETRFTTPDEFKAGDFIVATQIGTTNEAVAHDFVGVDRTQSFEDFGLAVQAVLSGDADAVMIDTISAKGFMDENPGKLMVLPEGVTSDEQLALVFPPGSELIVPFTDALHAFGNDGTLADINAVWFGAP